MSTTCDIRCNCVRIKADIKGRGLQFCGSGVLYPLGTDIDYDYVITAQHILKAAKRMNLASQIDKISTIEIEIFDGDSFTTYKTIIKENIVSSLLPIGKDFLIIKIDKGSKQFVPFILADDLIEEKPMQLWGISREAMEQITRLECKCVDKRGEIVNITSYVDNMGSLQGMSGGGVFALNQPLMYGVLWKYAATKGEFHNVKISQALEDKIKKQLADRQWASLKFINIAQCKHAMVDVYDNVFHDINDSILINRNNTRFPLENRFVMPDFIETIQVFNSVDDPNKPKSKENDVDTTSIYHRYNEMQEYGEHYLKEYYRQLNETSNREVRIPASSILNPDRKILLIVGGPGSGKSSLLKYLTLQLLKGKMSVYDGYLPIWMPFSYMARNCDSSIKDIIQDWLQERKLWEKYNHYLEYAFAQQKILLIADGIDEWGDDPLLADKVISKVKAETEIGNLITIFSSREYGIANINSPFSSGDTYTIAPLSVTQQKVLVEKCVNHYNGLIQDTQRTASFLSAKLRLLQDIDRMKENPMLLTILIGQYLQGNDLPHNNIAAMDCVVEQLFVKHQQSRKYQASDYSKSFDYTSNKMMLGVLSKEMFDYYYDGCIDKTQAEILLNQYLNSQTTGQELNNAHIVDKLFNHDTHQLGVIEERTGSRISFINRQLQEFMTAKYLSIDENRAKEFIIKHASDSRLHQVVVFLFEMMPASAFVGLFKVLKPIVTDDYRNYYLHKLKLEVLVRSLKAPKDFLLSEIEEYIQKIEWESDYDIKHDTLEILLDGLYNVSLVNRIEDFISKYIPSVSVFHDNRLSGLMRVNKLMEEERLFVVLTVINGDIRNKILASDVIKKHIAGDCQLLEMVNSYITASTQPEVLAFFIRSVAVEGIDIDKEDELIKTVGSSEIYTRFYKIVFSLFKGEAVTVEDFLEIVYMLPYTIREEATWVLQKYYADEEKVRKEALKSVNAQFRQRENMSTEMAWHYLLSCWLNHPEVINAVSEELKKTYPFNVGNRYELWGIIKKQELSDNLRKVITDWAVCCSKEHLWSAEFTIVNTIANDSRIKTKLLESLESFNNFQHLVVYPLINNWGQDRDVIERLQRYLDEESLEKSSWIAGFAYEIYQGDDNRIKAYLDRCINNENARLQKDRAVHVYINRYKDEFAQKYIQRILKGEILMSDHIIGSKWNILSAIIENYSERPDVQDFLHQNYTDDYRFAGQIIAEYHGSELAFQMLGKCYHLDTRLRLMMIHKITNLSHIDERIEEILRLFQQEDNDYVLCDTVLCLISHLRRKGKDEDVFKIANDVFYTTQLTTECAYKIRFCIYLIYHRIDDYIQFSLDTGTKEYEFAQFNIFYNDSPYIEKTIADEADYLLANDMANLKKIVKDDKKIYSYVVFFSKYVNPTSESAKIILKYINENKGVIDNPNILLFIKKVGNEKPLLKELIIANINNLDNEMTATVAQIISSDFDTDDDIKQLLNLDDWRWYNDSLCLVSHNCSLNTNVDKLKSIYRECKDNKYPLDGSYATYNFVFSLTNENKVVEKLNSNITKFQDEYVYRMIITPLIVRLKRDKALAEKCYEELLTTDDSRIRIGYYSILSSAGVKSTELRNWREQQHEHLNEYGHDIVLNRDRRLIASLQ